MSIRTFCDICGNELTRNMVNERLLVNSHAFEAEVLISKNGVANEGDLCLNCLLEMLNQKPKRKYERKKKQGQALPPPGEDTEIAKEPSGEPLGFDIPDLISTFSVVTGQDGRPHTLKMGDTAVSNKNLKAGVVVLLGLRGLTIKDVEDEPDSEGKRNLLNILNPK